MPDLLGPCPCGKCACYHGAFCTNGNLIGVGECPRYAAYHARRELLEALQAGGVKCKAVANLFLDESGENASWNMARSADGKRGHLIFIPEVQE